jgi:hypothetical protein
MESPLPNQVSPGWGPGYGQAVYPVHEWYSGVPVVQAMPSGYGAPGVSIAHEMGPGVQPVYFEVDHAAASAQRMAEEYAAWRAGQQVQPQRQPPVNRYQTRNTDYRQVPSSASYRPSTSSSAKTSPPASSRPASYSSSVVRQSRPGSPRRSGTRAVSSALPRSVPVSSRARVSHRIDLGCWLYGVTLLVAGVIGFIVGSH